MYKWWAIIEIPNINKNTRGDFNKFLIFFEPTFVLAVVITLFFSLFENNIITEVTVHEFAPKIT